MHHVRIEFLFLLVFLLKANSALSEAELRLRCKWSSQRLFPFTPFHSAREFRTHEMDSALQLQAANPLLNPLCSTSQISQSIRANHLENDRAQNGIEKVVRPLVRSFLVNQIRLSIHFSIRGKKSKSVFAFLTYSREIWFAFSYGKVLNLDRRIEASDEIYRASKFDYVFSFFDAKQNARVCSTPNIFRVMIINVFFFEKFKLSFSHFL